jgi:hypothetical protein
MNETVATKDRQYLVAENCWREGLGYIKRGSIVTIPAGSKARPSVTWTEVDESGRAVEGGQKARRLPRYMDQVKELRLAGELSMPEETNLPARQRLAGGGDD